MKQNVAFKKVSLLTIMQCKIYMRLNNLGNFYGVLQFFLGKVFFYLALHIFQNVKIFA